MEVAINSFPILLKGAIITLQLTLVGEALGMIIGLFVGLGRLSDKRVVKFLSTCYVDFIRGTPLLVQLFIIYFGIPDLLRGIQDWLILNYNFPEIFTNIGVVEASIAAISINSGAYIAEIFRAGVQSIDKGQMEAARSLGMTQVQAMTNVILPQAFRRVIPPLGNEFIAMLKDTALLSVIGMVELFRRAQFIIADTYVCFAVLIEVAMFYFAMTWTISRFVDYLERRLKVVD